MCGIVGVIGTSEAAMLVAVGLHHLQHRGQEAAGIVSWDGALDHQHREGGLAGHIFTEEILKLLPGSAALGQVLYSTFEQNPEDKKDRIIQKRTQPFTGDFSFGPLAIAHNGNLTNAQEWYKKLLNDGCRFDTKGVDTEVALQLIGRAPGDSLLSRIQTTLPLLEGSYSFIILSRKQLIGIRDPRGIRPLSMGRIGNAYAFASETCALEALQATDICEVPPGKIVVVENGKMSVHTYTEITSPRPCIFEYAYFARPDSELSGKNVYLIRKEIGRQLALEAPVLADMVIPIPDSGVPHAMGYAKELGIDFEHGIVRNHYVWRTFIEPLHRDREKRAVLKSSPIEAVVRDKRLVLVDDSLIRGTTSTRIVKRLFDAGAKEIHLRIAYPPWRFGCYWGIDEADPRIRVAEPDMTYEEVCEKVKNITGVTSVAYISVDGIYRAVHGALRNSEAPQSCDFCFTGDRPTSLTNRFSRNLH